MAAAVGSDERAGAQVKARVVETHAGNDLDGDDRRDGPINHKTSGLAATNDCHIDMLPAAVVEAGFIRDPFVCDSVVFRM